MTCAGIRSAPTMLNAIGDLEQRVDAAAGRAAVHEEARTARRIRRLLLDGSPGHERRVEDTQVAQVAGHVDPALDEQPAERQRRIRCPPS